MSEFHKNASGKQFQYARENRKKPTLTEAMLWEKLRNRRLGGFKFRRQHPIKNFILDFYCHEYKLGIELDGSYHDEIDQYEYDEGRTLELKELGITILRFSNDDVVYGMEETVNKILRHLK
ncbi:endonuclease domain-containing protein [Ekhidna sp.]|jgi:very-short-patch-repair endonuclease|uniref:endonuclease domain-containing protein n=1 Tax=Ekhidna sp. TaxID=2608089 RepID=UPI0032EA9056